MVAEPFNSHSRVSSPRAAALKSLIDRVLSAHTGDSAVELAASLGVVDSYVSKLRDGYRPGRVRGDFLARLNALDPEQRPRTAGRANVRGVAETAQPYRAHPREYYLGMQDAAMVMLRTVGELQAQIGDALRSESPAAASAPTAPSPRLADVEAAERASERAQPDSPSGRSPKRKPA